MGTLSNKYFNAQAVEDALDKGVAAYDSMGQIELVYNGTDIRFNNEVVNFQQIVDYITTDTRFCYMVYNNRVLLTSDMQLTGGTRYVFFETSTTDSGLSKNAVVKVYSSDGTTISSISYSTIANENFSNKVSTIADNDKNSTVHYPSNKAVTEITDEIKEDLTHLHEDGYVLNAETLELISDFVQDGVVTSNNYYRQVSPLELMEYVLVVNVQSDGDYLIQCGTSGSVSSMVDVVYNGHLLAGKNIIRYTPTGNYTNFRSDKNEPWNLSLYKLKSESLSSIVGKNSSEILKTLRTKAINASDFATKYDNKIGNIEIGTIVNINPSHNASDLPFNISGYYTVITTGDNSIVTQIAIDLNGFMYIRKKTSSGWKAWVKDALEFSNKILTNTSVYSDFNDFPIGSIIGVKDSARLLNAPDGFNNTGHDVMDVGGVIVNVITFATSNDNPYIKSQIAVYYRQSISGKPRIAFRSAIYFDSEYHWSDWSVLSQDGAICSTNRIVDINHLDYTFDDFNKAPVNTVYQVDLNVANAVANNPSPGHSGSLMTYCFSNSVRHAIVQEYVTIENTRATMFIRYGFINVGNTTSWTTWEKVVTEQITN